MQKTILLVGLFALFTIAAAGEFRMLKKLLDEAERGGSNNDAAKEKMDHELSEDDLIKKGNFMIDYIIKAFGSLERGKMAILLHIGFNTDRLRQLNEHEEGKNHGGDSGQKENTTPAKRAFNLFNAFD